MGEEGEFELERGKTLYVKLNTIGDVDAEGYRTLYFTMNACPAYRNSNTFASQFAACTHNAIGHSRVTLSPR